MTTGYSEDQVALASACMELTRVREASTDLLNWVDMSDSLSFTSEDSVPTSGYIFNYNMAYAQALMRPSTTACAYINEHHLKMLRARSRAFCTLNPYWMAVKENKISYTIGTGHALSIVAKRSGQKVEKELLWKVEDELERFCRVNRYSVRQGEKLTRLDRDGEFFLRFFDNKPDGVLRVRFVEPILVQTPPGFGPEGGVWFGIRFDNNDFEEAVRYYIRSSTYDGGMTDEMSAAWRRGVPADQIQHRKVNVDIGSPRGLPTTYTLQDSCVQALSTLKSMGKLVDIRARIALIRKQVNATLGQIQPLLSRNRAGQVSNAAGQFRNAFQLPYGAVVDTNDQRQFDFPHQNIETDKIVHSLKSDLQSVAAAVGLADFTISGDFGCHDSSTELLTKRGWLKYGDVAYGDEAGTVNPTTGAFEWQPVQQMHVSDYDGEMVRFKNSHTLDMLVTPNHRMYAGARHSTRVGGEKIALPRRQWDFVFAEDFVAQTSLPNRCNPKQGVATECFTIPGVQYSQGLPTNRHMKDQSRRVLVRTRPDRVVPMSPWLSFLGWFVAEGWTATSKKKKEYAIGINQSLSATEECESIHDAVSGLGEYNFHENDGTGGLSRGVNGTVYHENRRTWTMRDKSLWSWLREHCGTDSYTKRIPSFVNDLPADQQCTLLDSAILGDGSHRGSGQRVYYTMSKQLADDIQSLAIQCGHAANFNKTSPSGKYTIAIGRASREVIVKKEHISRVPYRGTVWCATVPNGIIITRRNGKMAISGNSAFANALVKEGPMDRTISRLQEDMIRDDKEVYERALAVAADAGRLPGDVLEKIRLEIMPPGVIARERLVNTQADEILVRNGAMSPDTMAMRANLDPEDERDKAKANPSPQVVDGGDTRSMQPTLKRGGTARGVPRSNEPGPGINPKRYEEGLEEGQNPTGEDFKMASLVLTDAWKASVKGEIMALSHTTTAPMDAGVRADYMPGVEGVYLGEVDGLRIWAVCPLHLAVALNEPDNITAGNWILWEVPARTVCIDWNRKGASLMAAVYHELVEVALLERGNWGYARSHKMAGYEARMWSMELM